MRRGPSIGDILEMLESWSEVETSVLDRLLPALRGLLETDLALGFGIGLDMGSHRLDFLSASGLERPLEEAAERFDAWFRSASTRWALFTPRHVEPFQRNVAMHVGSWRQLQKDGRGGAIDVHALGLDEHEEYAILENLRRAEAVFRYLRRPDDQQLRILVCDGPTLLAWVGAFQSGFYSPAQQAALDALAAPLARRLKLEARLGREARHKAALESVLQAIAAPALITDSRGNAVYGNEAGRALLDEGGQEARGTIRDASKGCRDDFERRPVRIPGGPIYHLLIAHNAMAHQQRVTSVASRYGLTPREREVLLGLVRGWTNRRLATALGCAERTVETHVTRILAKLDVGSRAAAIARLMET